MSRVWGIDPPSRQHRQLLDLYLGGTPDPSWQPMLRTAWGGLALPGERGLVQRRRARTTR